MTTYRVGRKLGRTIYRGDKLIGMMDSREDAEMVVAALNGLSDADREALAWARDELSELRLDDHDQFTRAIALLDRLLGGEG